MTFITEIVSDDQNENKDKHNELSNVNTTKQFNTALLPVAVYASFRKDQNILLYTWACLLPCEAKIVKTPKLLELICGIDISASSGVKSFLSHELLILYRCTLWYFPHLLQNQSDLLTYEFDWDEHIREINTLLQYNESELYEKSKQQDNKCVHVIDFLHIFENAIMQCIMISKILLTRDENERKELINILPAILTLTTDTIKNLLDFEKYRTQEVISDSSLWSTQETNEIHQWDQMQKKYKSEEQTIQA